MGQVSVAHESKLSAAQWLALTIMAAGIVLARNGFPETSWIDLLGLAWVGLLIFWMTRRHNPALGEETGDGIAFRLGRKLSGVLRGKRL
jgi:hypothetical protein